MIKKKRSSKSIALLENANDPITSYRWGWYALSLFVPFAGILTGLFLYDQDSKAIRKVGRNCLFIGFIVWVVFPLLILMVVGVFLAMAAASWVADMLPAAD